MLQQFRGGEWIGLSMDPVRIDPSRQGQIAPMGCVEQPYTKTYGVPQFLDAILSGHHISALGALETPNLSYLVV